MSLIVLINNYLNNLINNPLVQFPGHRLATCSPQKSNPPCCLNVKMEKGGMATEKVLDRRTYL